jgi:two-component system CheB/CheR fusion protein
MKISDYIMEKKYLIALGASAGGVHALTEFFDNTLPDSVSYVITTHLYPHQRSMLTEIIQRHSSMEVFEVENEMEIQPNIVYVMPEDKVMSILDGKLILTKRDLSIKVNMAIDIFFNSLAKDTIFKKIAVILSGMGVDGTKGVKMIADAGGYVIAQSPVSAGEDSMPVSVIQAGYVNEILHPKQMPQAIINYVGRS